MDRKILGLSINLLLLLFCFMPIRAQQNTDMPNDTTAIPLYNGAYIGVDLFGLGSNLFGGDFLSTEVSIEVSLKNRFYPIVEIGYGTTDTWSDYGTHYKSSAPYFKIGMNYNTMFKKRNESHLFVGVRYALSSMTYDIEQMPVTDPAWGGDLGSNPLLEDEYWGGSIPYHHTGMKASVHWFEVLAGVRVPIYKRIMMGWTIRMKSRLSSSVSEHGDPWYVPGFGTYGSSQIGFTYSIIYKLPF